MRVESVTTRPAEVPRDTGAGRPASLFRGASSRDLEVTINGATRQFEASSGDGAMRNAMVGSLDAVDGLSATIRSDGRLVFVTDDARQLVIASLMEANQDHERAEAVVPPPLSAYLETGAEGAAPGSGLEEPAVVRPR